jgi:hypothetical protein
VCCAPAAPGSNTAADHIEVLDGALAQIPVDPRRTEVIARADTAGCTREFLKACREREVRFCVGHKLSIDIAQIIVEVPDKKCRPALSADGSELRDHAEVTEITKLADLSKRPEGTRMTARREHPHPGAQLTFCDAAGRRLQVLITDITADTDTHGADAAHIAYIEALHRGPGPSRTPDHRPQEHRTGRTPLQVARRQQRLAATVDDRARPAGMDQTARPRRRHGQSRTQTAPPLPAAHRSPAHPHRPPTHRQTRRRLALDP